MAQPSQGTLISVVDGEETEKQLVFDGCPLPHATVSRSATLSDLLQVDGDAPFPFQPESFRLWCEFSDHRVYNVKDLAGILKVRHPAGPRP